ARSGRLASSVPTAAGVAPCMDQRGSATRTPSCRCRRTLEQYPQTPPNPRNHPPASCRPTPHQTALAGAHRDGCPTRDTPTGLTGTAAPPGTTSAAFRDNQPVRDDRNGETAETFPSTTKDTTETKETS